AVLGLAARTLLIQSANPLGLECGGFARLCVGILGRKRLFSLLPLLERLALEVPDLDNSVHWPIVPSGCRRQSLRRHRPIDRGRPCEPDAALPWSFLRPRAPGAALPSFRRAPVPHGRCLLGADARS